MYRDSTTSPWLPVARTGCNHTTTLDLVHHKFSVLQNCNHNPEPYPNSLVHLL